MFNDFPETIEIPLAGWTNRLVDWMLVTFGSIFDVIADSVLWLVLHFEKFLLWLPWPAVILAVAAGAWFSTRSKLTTTVLVLLILMVGTFGFWNLMMMTLAIVISSGILALIIGLPVGILTARNRKVSMVVTPILDAMQTMPSFVYLIPAMMFFSLGIVPAVIATIIYAVPPLIRLTDLGIRSVAESAIEAAEAYGASPRQILREVQLPLALPAIMTGINQMTMMALAMVVIASMIGARGLGQEVLLAINRIDPGRGAEAGLSIVAIAIVMDRITQGFAKRYEESIT